MGVGNGEKSSGSEEESVEDMTFACPYCGEEFETAYEQGRCQASHFRGTGSVTKDPHREDDKKNIVSEWKRGEKK